MSPHQPTSNPPPAPTSHDSQDPQGLAIGTTPKPDDPADAQHLLAIYLGNHLAGATAGLARFRRTARAHRGTALGAQLDRLRKEVAEDRRALRSAMTTLGVAPQWSLLAAARVGEAVGALKPNGRLVRTSPLRAVVELEGLLAGVHGKAALWQTLGALAAQETRLERSTFDRLGGRAERQVQELQTLHEEAVRAVLVRPRR